MERTPFLEGRPDDVAPRLAQPRIWLLEANGQLVGPAGRQQGVFVHPVWSASGTRLAFLDRPNRAVTVALAADRPGVHNEAAACSPDGRFIAFVRSVNSFEETHLWIRNADGTGAHALTADQGFRDSSVDKDSPVLWSPEGRYILFGRNRAERGQRGAELWVADLNSGEMIDLHVRATLAAWAP